jgi:hypothetical protein
MSEDNTFPILAAIGFNDGANKGFWRVQPREKFGEDAGQWIEMGAELRMFFKNQRGQTANVTGRAVGSTGTPDGVRVLVQGQSEKGVPDGIYGANTSSVRVAEGFIPDEVLKEQGIENTVNISKEQEAALPTIDSLERADITDEDMRLINEGSNSKEAKEHAEYKKSVEAEEGKVDAAPSGSAKKDPKDMSWEELKEEVETPNPTDINRYNEVSKAFFDKGGYSQPRQPRVPEENAKKDPTEMSWEELKEEIETPNPTDLERYNKAIREFYRKGGYSQPRQPQGPEQEDLVVEDAFNKADSGESVPDLDSLIKFAKSPPKDAPTNQTKKRYPIELEPGMVVRDKGANFVVQDKPKQVGTTKDGLIKLTGFNVIEEGKKEVRFVRVDGSEPVDVLVGPDNKTPIKRDVVSPEVAKPATPEVPSKPNTPKKPSTRRTRINDLLKKFKDDGKDIAPAKKSREELYDKVIANEIDPETGELLLVPDINGKPRPINSPNAIEDAIFEETPGAKIRPDGAIVVERSTFVDTDGQKYKYEIRVERTIGNQFMERYIFSNPETGEVVHDFYNSDYKDSFSSLYGKSNGLVVTRDFFLGTTVPGKKGVDAAGVPNDKELRSYFGPNKTIANRIKYLQKIQGSNRMPRVITPESNMRRFLDGYGRLINKSDSSKVEGVSTLGTVARGFVADIYEIVASGDAELVSEAFKQAMGRMPNNPETTTALLNEFRRGLKERFAGTPAYKSIIQLPKQLAKKLVDEDLDLNDPLKVPFVSQDGVSILAPGRYVKFFNNENGSSIGRVTRLVAGSGKNGNYKDTVVVQFADKSVPNLQTRNMSPLTDDELDLTAINNDNLLTPYVPQLEGEEMRQVRLGIDYRDAANRKEDSPDDEPDDILDSGDAGAPYLGSDGDSGDSKPPSSKLVEDLDAGDPVYDTDGTLLGEVLVVELVSRDPDEYDITYESPEGEEFLVTLKAGELNGPK